MMGLTCKCKICKDQIAALEEAQLGEDQELTPEAITIAARLQLEGCTEAALVDAMI